MQIELRKLQVYQRASEETTAFDADVWVDGVKVGTASNTGKGEANRLHLPREIETRIITYCATLPHERLLSSDRLYPVDIDYFFSKLVADGEARQKAKRMLKDRVLLLDTANGQVLQTSKLSPAQRSAFRAKAGQIMLSEEHLAKALQLDPAERLAVLVPALTAAPQGDAEGADDADRPTPRG